MLYLQIHIVYTVIMKNILILSYDFKPLNTISANRTNSWFQYFNKYGLKPVVFTRKWNNQIESANDYLIEENGEFSKEEFKEGIIYRASFKKSFIEKLNYYFSNNNFLIARKILTFLSLIFTNLPYSNIEKTFYLKHIDKIIQNEKIDYIITSGEPFLLFKYASIISKKYKIPYILDYRDSWTSNPNNNDFLSKFLNKFNRFYEKKYLKNASLFTTVSSIIETDIKNNIFNQNSAIIENGYNKELYDSIITEDYKQFTIIYTGSISDVQPITPFLEGLEKFIKGNQKLTFKVIFIGILFRPNNNTNKIVSLRNKYPNIIEVIGKVSLQESIKFQKKSSVLLKFSLRSPIEGFYGGKLYEYYACDKQILNIVSKKENAITDFFSNNKIQTFAYSKDTVANKLDQLYLDFNNKTIRYKKLTNLEKESFSRENIAKTLVDKILNI